MSETQNDNAENLNQEGTGAAPAEPKAPGVGDVAKELIRAGKSNADVLAAIKEQFPNAKTSMASVNWYRNNLRQNGENVPTARELSAAGKAEAQAEKDRLKAEAKAKREQEKADKKAEKQRLKDEEKARKQAEKDEAKRKADEAKANAAKGGEAGNAGNEGGLDSALQ